MKKLLNYITIQDYRSDMTKKEKSFRDTKIACWLLLLLFLFVLIKLTSPLHATYDPMSSRFTSKQEWTCPNRACGYENMEGIYYCGLCGTQKGPRKR